ncbi:MAG: alpha/beta hydrolase [Gammaproteobacteria bacterium]|nr:alpha/beta hydrolase [Gammaproteobacteria bacterium]
MVISFSAHAGETRLNDNLPEIIQIETGANPEFAIIWLHGLGADGHDFEPIVPQLGLPQETAVRFIFPHAPHRPITLNGGMVMRGWYDISGMEMIRQEDAAGIEASAQIVRGLIDAQEAHGIPSERIILAGFSQGGAIVLFTGLRHRKKLAGIMALSTYLPLSDRSEDEASTQNRRTPIFMAHGLYDPIIALPIAEASRAVLQKLDYDIEWRTYAMPHSVSPEEISDISAWFTRVITQTKDAPE